MWKVIFGWILAYLIWRESSSITLVKVLLHGCPVVELVFWTTPGKFLLQALQTGFSDSTVVWNLRWFSSYP
jgi:predicted benzoate:H+ symporter BenE